MDSDFLSIIYWTFWFSSFMATKALGLFGVIAQVIPTDLPVHTIKYLPQLHEAIPALILTIVCAILSALVRRGVDRFFIYLKRKPTK